MAFPSLAIYRCRVTRSVAAEEGFPWNRYVGANSRGKFQEPPDGYAVISSIRTSDGMLGELKTRLDGKGGAGRKDIRRFVRGHQRRTNWGKRGDLRG